ncbi:hypothetical protein ASF98_00860 [Arthrobacter sp. Leaf337]|uniref:hypothetical protein n=1 Tax=Arthrobacter sp. Leaf337 TaxID=1736342 RepID=UPI0006F9CBBD|nr:hypothetical protein [Arthrobacter sp. Leaf337]KQR82596.1 hypothetical protein ASF98_00860 [Arthrobacter sp. Leaf337]
MIGIPLRFKTAVALVLLGLLTLLAGVGQKTIWAPAETFTATAPADGTAAPLTVIDQKLRTLHGGTVKINVKGEGSFMLAAGRPDDVDAWVGKTAHNTVSGVSEDNKSLQLAHAEGEAAAPSPAGSDLWVTTENASGELNYTWSAPADGEWSLLLASDGTKPAPSSISMTFPNDTSTPWAVPFMVLGGLLMLAGLALLVLKPKSGQPGVGGDDTGESITDESMKDKLIRRARAVRPADKPAPAAPVQPPVEKRPGTSAFTATVTAKRAGVAMVALAATIVAGTGVAAQAATTPAPSPSSSETAGADTAPDSPVLLDAQFRRILEQVSSTVDAGDAAKDAAKLKSRVDRTELEVRTQNYKIRSQVGAYEARMPVRATKLLTTVVTSKRAWPRSVMAVTQGEGNVVPQLLTLVQKSPRENYKLVQTTPLQPGTTFPAIGRTGTETLAADDKSGLLYSGAEALAGLGDRLTKADSTFKDKLVEGQSSPYIADTLAYQADVAKTGVNGNFSFTHKVSPEDTVVFRTADGGALVMGKLNFAFDGTPKAEGDKLAIGDDAAVLAGGKETSTGMVLNFAESMAVYIPPTGSKDPMKLVAATRGLVGASFK